MPIYHDPPVKRHKDKVNSAETLERESRPAPEEEVVDSHEPEKFSDFPEALDDDVDDDLPF